MDRLDPKSPEEADTYTFQFTSRLAPGESLKTCEFNATVDKGTDASFADLLDGAPVINSRMLEIADGPYIAEVPAKHAVLQRLKAGVHMVDYHLVAIATTNKGRTLSKHIILPVRTEGS